MVIEDSQATYAHNASVAVTDLCITGLNDSSEVIVEDRDILDLNNSTIVVVLYIRIVVVTRVEVKVHIVCTNVHINISISVSSQVYKIKLSIREN